MLHLETLFPRQSLGFFPSPIHPLHRLSRLLGREIWAKREDVSSGLAYGGNKIRKLEWLVADALATGCDTLVSIGGVQSNHTRQVAAAAAATGMACYTVQEDWAEWDDPVYDKVGNILLTRLMGGHTLLEGEGYSTDRKATFDRAIERVRSEGGKPYPIPAGASDHPLGGLGYAHFADELRLQEKAHGVFFDTIVVATCTGSTQGGMLAGFAAGDRPRRVIGIDTAHDAAMTYRAVHKIAMATVCLIAERGGRQLGFREDSIEICPDYSAPSYGVPSADTIQAIRLAAEQEAMLTDPVYEGKSMAGLIGLCRKGHIPAEARILYVHLGGMPALHAYHRAFEPVTALSETGSVGQNPE